MTECVHVGPCGALSGIQALLIQEMLFPSDNTPPICPLDDGTPL